jgi:hypothetical protein
MANALTDVQATFLSLDSQYPLLRNGGCQTQAQMDALADQYSTAELNYQTALNKTLSDDDPQVATLSTQLIAINKQVAQATTQMGDIAKVIGDITTAVGLGTQMLKMV